MVTLHLLLQALCIKCMQGVNGGHAGIPALPPTLFILQLIMEFDKECNLNLYPLSTKT